MSQVSAAPSSGAPRQWKALIGPLSSTRIRSSFRSREFSRSRTNRRTRPCQLANASISFGRFSPGNWTSAPWEPTYPIAPTPTSRRASATGRPDTQATSA